MVSVKRADLVSRVETAANLGFLVAIPALLLTAGVVARLPDWFSVTQFGASVALFAMAIGTFKRYRIAAVGQVVVFAAGASFFVYQDLHEMMVEPHFPLVTMLLLGIGFLLVRGARAVHVLHAVKRHPIPRESRYAFRPTTETVIIR